jgi:hypothetical protein
MYWTELVDLPSKSKATETATTQQDVVAGLAAVVMQEGLAARDREGHVAAAHSFR